MSQTSATVENLNIHRARAIAAMLASTHDGEVLNAARALVAIAADAGMKVQDLICAPADTFTGSPAQRRYDDAMRAYRATHATFTGQAPPSQSFKMALAHIQARAIGTKILNTDEERFIFQEAPRITTPTMSDRQRLFQLAQKLGIS